MPPMLSSFLQRPKKKRPVDKIDELDNVKFSEPITVFLNKVVAVGVKDFLPSSLPQTVTKLTPYTVTCLKDAIALNRTIVRDVKKRLNPMEGDLVCVIEEDPTDVYRQILFELAKRGKV